MKQPRRLDIATPQDPYRRAQRGLLRHVALSEADFRRMERERPDHIIVEGDAVLIAQPRRHRIDLHYAFPDRDGFARQFPGMLQRLLPAVSQEEAPLGFRLRLTDRPSRPYVEPVLFAHAFEVSRVWLHMTLVELPEAGPPADDLAPGFVLRPPRPDDAEAIVRLEERAFPNPMLTVELAREALRTAAVYRVLEETGPGALVGSLLAERRPPATGHIAAIAVHPDYQRRGLGEAMMRWALAWFQAEGLRRASLTVSIDNGPAIALYRKLGFAPGEVGLDYRRPIDAEEARQVLEKHRASHIRVRRR
jgi:mycothiol synthase